MLFLLKLTPAPPFWEALLFASLEVDFFEFALVFYSVNLLRVPILCWISASAGDLLAAINGDDSGSSHGGEGGGVGLRSALTWMGLVIAPAIRELLVVDRSALTDSVWFTRVTLI